MTFKINEINLKKGCPVMAKRTTKNEGKLIAKEEADLKTGTVRTIVLPGGAKMEMIYCAPGSFMMGSPKDEVGREDNEILHKVILTKGFWLGKYPVTQQQWETVMEYNPCLHSGERVGNNVPVYGMMWRKCRKFIAKIKSKSGLAVRFPTEAEWEYACRAGSRGAYSGTGSLDDMGWKIYRGLEHSEKKT